MYIRCHCPDRNAVPEQQWTKLRSKSFWKTEAVATSAWKHGSVHLVQVIFAAFLRHLKWKSWAVQMDPKTVAGCICCCWGHQNIQMTHWSLLAAARINERSASSAGATCRRASPRAVTAAIASSLSAFSFWSAYDSAEPWPWWFFTPVSTWKLSMWHLIFEKDCGIWTIYCFPKTCYQGSGNCTKDHIPICS